MKGSPGARLSDSRAVFLVLAISCGGTSTRATGSKGDGTDAPSGDPNGGQRLQAVFVEGADGVGVFRHFHDTELGLNCNFALAESGAWRCLPHGAEAARVMDIVYTDADCTEPHVALYASSANGIGGCTPPRHAVVGDNCGEKLRVFEIGAAVSADVRYAFTDGVCSASTTSTNGTDLFALRSVPLEEFQLAAESVGEETGGIVPVDLGTEDGARFRAGFRDAEEGFECFLWGSEDESRCMPTDLGQIGFLFADPGCAEAAAMAPTCTQQRSELAFAVHSTFGAEGTEITYHRCGARLPASYTGTPESCQPSMSANAFEVGAVVPFTRFAPGRQVEVVGGDLAVTVDTVATARLPARALRTSLHGGFDCVIAQGSDGQLRCMPGGAQYAFEFFADAACTQPAESWVGELLAVAVPDTCPARVRVYARGDRYSGPVYQFVDGLCTFAHETPPGDSGRTPHYVYPNEIPAADFPALFEVVR